MKTADLSDENIDLALGPIARALPCHADLILDIRAAARERLHPGSCVRCFFQLVSSAPQAACLRLLRDWLEQNIEIVARGGSTEILERLPLILDGDDLETYCREVMRNFHMDRAHGLSLLELEFRYRETRLSAAA